MLVIAIISITTVRAVFTKSVFSISKCVLKPHCDVLVDVSFANDDYDVIRKQLAALVFVWRLNVDDSHYSAASILLARSKGASNNYLWKELIAIKILC